MLWIIITVLCGAAIAIRVYTLGGHRPQVWWIAFTATLLFIIPGAGLLWNESAVNAYLGINNIAVPLSNLCFIAAAGSVQIYVHSLRRTELSRAWISVHILVAVVVALVGIGGWLIAPIHDVAYPRLRLAPYNPQAWLYFGVFHVYLGTVLANVCLCAREFLRTTQRDDPGRRIGSHLVCGAAAIDVVAHLTYLTHLGYTARGGSGRWIADLADLFTLISMCGIVAGTITFVAVPEIVEIHRARRLAKRLRPLWDRVCAVAPGIVLPADPRESSLYNRVERMIIEITDGLTRVHVDDSPAVDPIQRIARSLLINQPSSGTPASLILPRPPNRQDEEEILLRLADSYTALRSETQHAS